MTETLQQLQSAPQQFIGTILSIVVTEHIDQNNKISNSQTSPKLSTSASDRDDLLINGTAPLDNLNPISVVGYEAREFAKANTALHASSEDISEPGPDVDIESQIDDTFIDEESCKTTIIDDVDTASLFDTPSLHISPLPLQSTCTNGIDTISEGAAQALTTEPGGNEAILQDEEGSEMGDADSISLDLDLGGHENQEDKLSSEPVSALDDTLEVDEVIAPTICSEEKSDPASVIVTEVEDAYLPLVAGHCGPVIIAKTPQGDEAQVVDSSAICGPPAQDDIHQSDLFDDASSVLDETPAVLPSQESPLSNIAKSDSVIASDLDNLLQPKDEDQSSIQHADDHGDDPFNSDDHSLRFCCVLPIIPTEARNWNEDANTVLCFVERQF